LTLLRPGSARRPNNRGSTQERRHRHGAPTRERSRSPMWWTVTVRFVTEWRAWLDAVETRRVGGDVVSGMARCGGCPRCVGDDVTWGYVGGQLHFRSRSVLTDGYVRLNLSRFRRCPVMICVVCCECAPDHPKRSNHRTLG